MTRRVLILSTKFTVGVAPLLPALVARLPRLGFEPTLGVSRAAGSPELLATGAPIVEMKGLKWWRRARGWLWRPRFLSAVRELPRPDVILGYHLSTMGWAVLAARSLGCACAGQIHLTYADATKLVRYRADRVDAVLGVTEATVAPLRARPRKPRVIEVVGNGTDVEALERRAREPCPLPGERYVLCAARVFPGKNQIDAVRAVARLEDRPMLVVAGTVQDEPYRRAVEAEAERLGVRVRFLGHVENIAPLMAGALAMVHPSRVEGFGVVIIEALALGVPVIAYGIAPVREVLAKTEGLGDEVPPDDVEGLSAGLGRALAADRQAAREELRRQGAEVIARAYGFDAVAERTAAALEAACEGRQA